MEPESTPPPDTIRYDDPIMPKGPWDFWKEALPGGFSRWGVHLILAWIAFDAFSGTAWALHLKRLAGWSALPNYWGELLTVRDVWELAENGGLKQDPLGFQAPLIALACLMWVFWAGWRVQTKAVDLPTRFGAWAWGWVDALLIGGIPVFILGFGLSWILEGLASTGIQGLGWLNLVASPLFKMACISTVMVQWWLCRVDRAGQPDENWHLGSPEALGTHLGHSFQRLWLHPVQWGTFILGGVILRLGVHFLVFLLAWRMGGGTSFRVWMFLVLQLTAAAVNAWFLGWFLRLSALYWRRDARVRKEILALERIAEGDEEPA